MHITMQAALRAAKKELERPPLVRKDIVARIRPEPDNETDAKIKNLLHFDEWAQIWSVRLSIA